VVELTQVDAGGWSQITPPQESPMQAPDWQPFAHVVVFIA
jgi:hypothetical protein